MQIVLDVADEFKPVLDELTLLLRVAQAKVEEIFTTPAPDYAAIERELAARTAAIEAESHGILLRAADLDAPRILLGARSTAASAVTPPPTTRPLGPSSSVRSTFAPTARAIARSIR